MLEPGIMVLLTLLLVACWTDWSASRIPNWLVLPGAVLGLAWNAALADHGPGWVGSFEGCAVGLALFLPLYAIRAMSAGDAKLMAMVGSYLGPVDVIGAAVSTFLVGALLAFAIALRNGVVSRMLRNVWYILVGSIFRLASGSLPTLDPVREPAARMPYGIAIAVGTATFLAWQRSLG
jgi:prepilin peptidase CpaA